MNLSSGSKTEEQTLDARGQKCPLPVLKTEKALGAMEAGQKLIVYASDPMARIDIPLYCKQNGHSVVVSEAEGNLRFEIVRGVR